MYHDDIGDDDGGDDTPHAPNTLHGDVHDNAPLKIYVKPSVSFDPSTKPGVDVSKDCDDGDDKSGDDAVGITKIWISCS